MDTGWRTCAQKVRYRSAAKARQANARMRQLFGDKKVYRCPYCNRWHLTSDGRTWPEEREQ